MANGFQKMLFSIAATSPVAICYAFVSFSQNNFNYITVIALGFGVIFSLYSFIFIALSRKLVEPMDISLTDVSSNDKYVWAYITGYIIPVFGVVVKEVPPLALCIITILIILVLTTSNTAFFNPVLRLLGYHFYNVSTISGVSNYCLISKRKEIHNAATVKLVHEVFGYFLIERR